MFSELKQILWERFGEIFGRKFWTVNMKYCVSWAYREEHLERMSLLYIWTTFLEKCKKIAYLISKNVNLNKVAILLFFLPKLGYVFTYIGANIKKAVAEFLLNLVTV